MYAIHPEVSGATYRAPKEEFLSRTPLPLTDVVIGTDGHMYFTVGGRGTQSELYRVRYIGDESTESRPPLEISPEHALRRKLEGYHTDHVSNPSQAANDCLAGLQHPDRYVRYAARVGLERLPVDLWRDAILRSNDSEVLITGSVALAHVSDASIQTPLLQRLATIDAAQLTLAQRFRCLLRA